jgi:hypothetical protein
MALDHAEHERLLDAWLKYSNATKRSADRDDNWWAVEQVLNWRAKETAPELWRFVQLASEREMTDAAWTSLAAGPLEDLLSVAGEEYIEIIEEEARRNPKFNDLLGGVWQNTMSNAVWQRITAVRLREW